MENTIPLYFAFRYHSTIRSNTCHMLIKNPGDMELPEADAKNLFRCEECKRIRTQVMSMRGNLSKQIVLSNLSVFGFKVCLALLTQSLLTLIFCVCY